MSIPRTTQVSQHLARKPRLMPRAEPEITPVADAPTTEVQLQGEHDAVSLRGAPKFKQGGSR